MCPYGEVSLFYQKLWFHTSNNFMDHFQFFFWTVFLTDLIRLSLFLYPIMWLTKSSRFSCAFLSSVIFKLQSLRNIIKPYVFFVNVQLKLGNRYIHLTRHVKRAILGNVMKATEQMCHSQPLCMGCSHHPWWALSCHPPAVQSDRESLGALPIFVIGLI